VSEIAVALVRAVTGIGRSVALPISYTELDNFGWSQVAALGGAGSGAFQV